PAIRNVVAVWDHFPNGYEEGPIKQEYFSLLADDVICGSGSGSGSGGMFMRGVTAAAALARAPLEWELEAKGFTGAAKVFAGQYRLKFRNDTLDACVWDN